jgi:hypothetical protein
MSEEIALAAADLATVEQLRTRVLEWENCYDRLAGAFELHMDILECKQALADFAGIYYDVVLGAHWSELEAARAVVEAAWTHDWGNIGDALYEYQKATEKGRTG